MLDLIRANAQSWGVKIAFGIIILVFVFWGVGGLTGGPSTVILPVHGEDDRERGTHHHSGVPAEIRTA